MMIALFILSAVAGIGGAMYFLVTWKNPAVAISAVGVVSMLALAFASGESAAMINAIVLFLICAAVILGGLRHFKPTQATTE